VGDCRGPSTAGIQTTGVSDVAATVPRESPDLGHVGGRLLAVAGDRIVHSGSTAATYGV
jgi:hypothetical protein